MTTKETYPHEFRIPVSQDFIRSIKDPHSRSITIIHALIKVRDIPNGRIPDKINPRSHETLKMTSRIPEAIEDSIMDSPKLFHLLNRGCLILAKKAWYDNKKNLLHFIIESADENGLVDGATTDRVLKILKRETSNADFESLKEDEIPPHFKDAFIHVEIIAGELEPDLRLKLADARNTSEQVKEFSLQDLAGKFEWLKELLEKSEFREKIRYRENEPNPVDIRNILALLLMFHPKWLELDRDPIVAYTGKGTVLEYYKNEGWIDGFKKLEPVLLDIIKLYDHIHLGFQQAYKNAYGADGERISKLGGRKGVRCINSPKKAKLLPLSGKATQYVIPDGWLYPIMASLRMLLGWPPNGRGKVTWRKDPFAFFDNYGSKLVFTVVERSQELGGNPNATGKSKGLWEGLRDKVSNLSREQ